ncbi:MAG: hypothetical protein RBS43_00935 [Candidatus Cloacimonas sp.]|nr:hypothetical protein [Candidatus Cloacimonas sp.]
MIKKIVLVIIALSAIAFVALSARAPMESTLQTQVVDEASGIACSKINAGIVWTHNDSGGKPVAYALNNKGMLVASLELQGVKNRDWEDIALAVAPVNGKTYLYLADIGDNNARYKSVFVYRVEEPQLKANDSLLVSNHVETIEIQYEDGARDAEALFVEPTSQDIYIISKREEQVGLYRVAHPYSSSGINIAKRISKLPLTWVTAADISPNGKYLLVKTYTGVWRYKIRRTQKSEITLNKHPKALPYRLEPQGEGLCFDAKGKGYYTLSEAGESGTQVLYYYR